jgi:xanthine dehydrogenase YagS FAD-binding subunit
VALDVSGSTIRGGRVVMGAVAPIPWRSTAAEQALAGKPLSAETAMAAADAAVNGAKPMSGNKYKVQVARTAVKRAIMKAGGLKGNWW